MDADEIDDLLETREDDALVTPASRTLSPWNVDGVVDHLEASAAAEKDDVAHSSAGPPLICCFAWCLYRPTSHDKYS